MAKLAKVPTIQLAKIDRVLKVDADAHRLIDGLLMATPTDDDGNDVVLSRASAACQSAGRCSVGALMWAVPSIPVEALVGLTSPSHRNAKKLLRAYGLLPQHIEAIIIVNDSVEDAENNGARYDEVMAFLTFVEWAQQAGVRFAGAYAVKDAYRDGYFND